MVGKYRVTAIVRLSWTGVRVNCAVYSYPVRNSGFMLL